MTTSPERPAVPGSLKEAAAGPASVRAFDLDSDEFDAAWVEARLAPDEQARADKRVEPVLRARAARSRALTREVLGAVLGAAPLDLTFEEGPHGKPGVRGAEGLDFSIAHSGPRLVIAVVRRGVVGADVELPSPDRDRAAIAARTFAPVELAALEALPDGARERGFLRLWTFKEACLKAAGLGIQGGLRNVVAGEGALAALGAHAWTPGRVACGGLNLDVRELSELLGLAARGEVACLAVGPEMVREREVPVCLSS